MNPRTCFSGAAPVAAPWLFRAGRGALFAIALCALLLPRPARAGENRRLRKGRILYKSGKYHKAIEMFRVVIETDSRSAEAYLWLGKAYNRISEPAKAVDSLEKAREFDPEAEEVYRVLGLSYLDLMGRARAKGEANLTSRHLDHAKKLGKELLRRRPKDKESYEFLITLAKSQKKLDEAIRYCEEVLKIDPNDVSTHLDLINILVAQKKLDAAERRCKELLRISPKLHAPKLILARIYQLRGDTDGAIEQLTKIIEQRKSHLEARLRRAEIYLAIRQYEKALADAEAVAKFHENHPYAHFIRGAVLMQLKKLDDAIDEFQRAVANPMMKRHFASHFWLARCLLVKQRNREAIAVLSTAVAIQPVFIPARLFLAWAHMQEADFDKAIEVLLAVEKIAPRNFEVLRLLRMVYQRKGDEKKAADYLEKMRKVDPEATRRHEPRTGSPVPRPDAPTSPVR